MYFYRILSFDIICRSLKLSVFPYGYHQLVFSLLLEAAITTRSYNALLLNFEFTFSPVPTSFDQNPMCVICVCLQGFWRLSGRRRAAILVSIAWIRISTIGLFRSLSYPDIPSKTFNSDNFQSPIDVRYASLEGHPKPWWQIITWLFSVYHFEL